MTASHSKSEKYDAIGFRECSILVEYVNIYNRYGEEKAEQYRQSLDNPSSELLRLMRDFSIILHELSSLREDVRKVTGDDEELLEHATHYTFINLGNCKEGEAYLERLPKKLAERVQEVYPRVSIRSIEKHLDGLL